MDYPNRKLLSLAQWAQKLVSHAKINNMELARVTSPEFVRSQTIPSNYHIRRRLGEGGFGQVFDAWDSKLCRGVALKLLKSTAISAHADDLIREARLAASLKHTSFVKIFSVEGDGDTQIIVMELIEGVTMRQQLQKCRFDENQLLDITLQIAEAMKEAHSSGLVHGDIKPSNLMIEPSGKLRILDFGLARKIDHNATQSSAVEDTTGTVAYMAPERLLGQTASVQTDIYALGVILYEMLTGSLPFADLNGLALAAAHLQSSSLQWPFPATAGPAIVALVHAMVNRDLRLRLNSMHQVCARIGQLQRGVTASATSTPTPSVTGPLISRLTRLLTLRRPHFVLAAGICTVCLTVVLSQFMPLGQWMPMMLGTYSETKTLRSAMASLRAFDRDVNLDDAEHGFDLILEHNSQNAAAAAGLSIVYSLRYAGDGRDEVWLQRADASAQQALKLNDQLALGYVAAAWVKKNHGKNDDALASENKALSLDPLNLFALMGKANLQITMRRFDDAEQTIKTAMNAYPTERIFTDLLGTLNYQKGNYATAEQAFRHSIKIEPDSSVSYANLNAALLRENRGDEALQVLQQGLQIRPDGRLYTNLGTTLFSRGDYVGAAAAFEHAVSSSKGSPNYYFMWANLADALHWIPGRAAEAQQAYLRATQLLAPLIERTPENTTRLSRMGLYCAHLGDKQGAMTWSQRAVSAAPSSPDVQFRAAVADELTGQRELAIEHLLRAKSLGYPINLIDSELDLVALRRDPRYQRTLMESAK